MHFTFQAAQMCVCTCVSIFVTPWKLLKPLWLHTEVFVCVSAPKCIFTVKHTFSLQTARPESPERQINAILVTFKFKLS